MLISMKDLLGSVTNEEKNEIKEMFERKIALVELTKVFNDPSSDLVTNNLYEKLIADLGKVCLSMEKWWSMKAQMYKWKSVTNGHWEIDFDNNNIYLVY